MAVGVVTDSDGRILIAKRPAGAHQGGLWEFPGGKVEPGESVLQALKRELYEELGVRPTAAACPLIRIPHHYPDKSVLLDVWRISGFTGHARGLEGQSVRWVQPAELVNFAFPAANGPIVTAAGLPDHYLVTPEPGSDVPAFLAHLKQRLTQGVRLVQLRAHGLDGSGYERLAVRAASLAREHGARLLLNATPDLALRLGLGLHLTSRALAGHRHRPLPARLPVAASCHTPGDLARAVELGLDFVVLGPVAATRSHPGVKPLGFSTFAEWIRDVPIPVYALGGLSRADLPSVQAARGQGVAAIRGLWNPGSDQ